MNEYLFDQKIISLVEDAKKRTLKKIYSSNRYDPKIEWEYELNKSFIMSGYSSYGFNRNRFDIQLKYLKEDTTNIHYPTYKSIIGGAMVLSGQPFLKKRFVMKGSAAGTSIASKYLSKILPQKMPFRIIGTKVLGRAIGRAIPYVGWALLAIDAIELVVELYEDNKSEGGYYEKENLKW